MDELQIKMSTKEVADFFGISKDTLRFYEDKGIIPPISRDEKGYRVYRNYDLNLIYLILELKKLGFSLNKISEFVNLFINPTPNSLLQQQKLLSDQIKLTKTKIVALEEIKKVLEDKLEKFNDQFGQYEKNQQFKTEAIWKNYQREGKN